MVGVLEGQQLAAVRVDEELPARQLGAAPEAEAPDQPVVVSPAHRSGERFARLVLRGGVGHDLQRRLAPQDVGAVPALGVGEADLQRLLRGDPGLRVQIHVAPGLGAEQHQVAVVQRGRQAAVPHRNPVQLLGDADLPQMVAHRHGPRPAELGRIDADQVGVGDRECADQFPHHAGVHADRRTPKNVGEVIETLRVAAAAPRDQRHPAQQGGQRAGSGIHEELELRAVLGEEPLQGHLPGPGPHPARIQRNVRTADPQVVLRELLLLQTRLLLGRLQGQGHR